MFSLTQTTLPDDLAAIANDLGRTLAALPFADVDGKRAAMRAARERVGDDDVFELVKGRAIAGLR